MTESKTTERWIIQRRFPKAALYGAREWRDFNDYHPDRRSNVTRPAVFKTLAEAKKARAKCVIAYKNSLAGHGAEFRIVHEVSTRTVVE